jgi:hypothetical protein
MDENHPSIRVKAPGRQGSGIPLRLPGHGSFPRVDDHLVEPEVTRDEMIGGIRIVAMPANAPHGTQHTRLDYVVQAHVTSGYVVAADLLTRHDQESDFATDVCVLRDGIDPKTGARHLEEVAFEVVSEQNERYVTEKAVRMHRRGVRRIFTVWVKGQRRVCEWSGETRSWRLLAPEARIEDPCFVAPLAVAALLDAATADNAVVEAMAAKGNPELQRREAAARAEAETEAEAAEVRANAARARAEAAEARAESERVRAAAEQARAEAERARAEAAEAEVQRLRSLLDHRSE